MMDEQPTSGLVEYYLQRLDPGVANCVPIDDIERGHGLATRRAILHATAIWSDHPHGGCRRRVERSNHTSGLCVNLRVRRYGPGQEHDGTEKQAMC